MNSLIYILLLLILALIAIILLIDFDYKNKLKVLNSKSNTMLKNIGQEMLNIMSLDIKASDKIVKLNKEIIKIMDVDYSTICLYDGYNLNVVASNVEKEYVESIKDIVEDRSFKTNISRRNAKLIIAEDSSNLEYKSAIERNISSCLMIPICFEQNFLGFILLEEVKSIHLKEISDEILTEFKLNLASFIENVEFQKTLETSNIIDTQTGFYNTVYLYSNVRKILATCNNTAMIVIKLSNLPDINESYTRNIGNMLLIKLANCIKETLGNDNIYVRFSGLKIIILIKNKIAEAAQPDIEKLLSNCKDIYEMQEGKKVKLDINIVMHTLKKQSNLDSEIDKAIKYLEHSRGLNTIKII